MGAHVQFQSKCNKTRSAPAADGMVEIPVGTFRMFFGSQRAMKSVAAAETAAIVAWRILNVGDRIGGVVFNDTDIAETRPQRSRRIVLRLLNNLVVQNQALGIGRGIMRSPAMLNQALDRIRRLAAHADTPNPS